MINKDRIVPIQRMDWLTAVGTMLTIANVSYTVLTANDVEGDFTDSSAGTKLCNQPVKSVDFASSVSSATVYFVPDYGYKGFSKNGAAITNTGAVNPDGVTLYKAVLSSGTVTITAVSPVAS